jgi:glycosyltransferase involved in cell wall biosynthesis
MPTLTVVIPTYNRGAELRRALESLAAQTRQDFEVIVCDDGSEEDLRSVVDGYAGRLGVEYVRIENSGGPARPRNVGTARASAPWISFLDSDDWWKPERVETVLPSLAGDVDVVYHPLRAVGSGADRRCVRRVGRACGPDPLGHMLTRGNPIPNSAAIVRRSWLTRIGGIAEDLSSVEDFDAWLRLAEAGARFRFVDEELGYYALTENSISVFTERQLVVQRRLFEKHLTLVPPALRSLAESNFSYLLGSYALRLGDRATARSYLARVRGAGGLTRRVLALAKYVYAGIGRPRARG